MKKILFIWSFLWFAFPVFASENTGGADYDEEAEIKPLDIQLSAEEKLQENSTDLNFIENETKLADLPCNDEYLAEKVREFILQNTETAKLRSVTEKRSRLLLVKNLHEFEECDEKEAKEHFETSAALVTLRINQNRQIKHICISRGNSSKKFGDIYILIYQELDHYKVTVTNLIKTQATIDNASFIYSEKK
ncbi:MAG: hypothetical protein J6039_01365 [Alphaproteobacteria bacterium]|nr:hypothetical protein [Alphaproteobacteria bacterium]